MLSVNTFICARFVSAQKIEEFHRFLGDKPDLAIGLYRPERDCVICVGGEVIA
jgi:hypothetical protein